MKVQIDIRKPKSERTDSEGWILNVVNASGEAPQIIRRARLFTGVLEWRVRSIEDDSIDQDLTDKITREYDAVNVLRDEQNRHPGGSPMATSLWAVLRMLEESSRIITDPESWKGYPAKVQP